eukprot:gene30837-37173_t
MGTYEPAAVTGAPVPAAPPSPLTVNRAAARAAMALRKMTLANVDVKGKRVFIRVDFNVPQDKADPSKITNTQRIDAALPTIKAVLDSGCKSVVLASHLGRPDGNVVPKFSLAPVAQVLRERLGRQVQFQNDCVGAEVEAACRSPAPGSVILLENLRFHVEEEGKGVNKAGDKVKAGKEEVAAFRASLRRLADVSMLGEGYDVRCAGILMGKELKAFSQVLDDPKRPVSDKIQLIMNLLDKVDEMIIGGGMAYTFLKGEGMSIGTSLYDEEGAKIVPQIIEKAKRLNVRLILPVDFVISSKFGEDGEVKQATKEGGIPAGFMGLTTPLWFEQLNREAVARSGTILWNGPMGVFEMKKFEHGTKDLMEAVIAGTKDLMEAVIAGTKDLMEAVIAGTKDLMEA